MRVIRLALVGVIAAMAACGEQEFEPPDRADRVAEAEARYSPARFDSVTWASDSLRAQEGNVVYATYCRNCHGPLGRGGTDYALQRELSVPSLVAPGWRYEAEPDSVRHRVFVGHVRGMPTWGVAGLTPREIDAVTHYILAVLRPEYAGG